MGGELDTQRVIKILMAAHIEFETNWSLGYKYSLNTMFFLMVNKLLVISAATQCKQTFGLNKQYILRDPHILKN